MLFLKVLIDQAETRDRGLFLREYSKLVRSFHAGKPCELELEALRQAIEASIKRVEARKATFPDLHFPENLPVCQQREKIAELITAHQVLVIAGETGSGKTTQLPKICLGIGLGARGLIGHTQPRRLAARSVAARVVEEMGVAGEQHCVGFKVRFTDQTKPGHRIKLMTDGILLNELQSDRFLSEYEVLIIDEAHERSLNIDFVLGYLKYLLPKRPELKVIITSATLDPERFSQHFNQAPILEVSGRVYPVELRYRSPVDTEKEGQDFGADVLSAVQELSAEGPGDILVFLSGEREIREIAELLQGALGETVAVLPLYGRLSLNEQNRVFQLQIKRRVVLSTNVAETSLTVPGIRYVIDTGLARISRYNYRTKIQCLPIEPISRASANQRMGRCGRIEAGICIRLYSEEDFLSRPEFTEAEILRTNLASVILQMLYLRLGDVESFPFVDPPERRSIQDGFRLLEELNALDEKRLLTPVGRTLARLPVEPRFGRMLIEAAVAGCLHEALIVVSFMSVQDPRERPLDKQQQSDQKHYRFRDAQSDFMGIVNLWEYLQNQRETLSGNAFKRLCHQDFLSFTRVREWREVYRQLTELCRILGMKRNRSFAHRDFVHKALLSGLLSHIGYKTEEGDYQGARNSRFYIFPASALYKQKPQWLMAAELVETSRLFARINAGIQPDWLEKVGAHLVKRSYGDPHWEKKRGCVVAFEQLTLYGLVIVASRKVNYSAQDSKLCRELFISHALIEGELISKAAFLQHNKALRNRLEEEEQRHRHVVFHWNTNQLYDYFDHHIPADICTVKAFDCWYRNASKRNPALLCLQRDDVVEKPLEEVDIQFPQSLKLDDLLLHLDYRFEPAHAEDGVTVRIPLEIVSQLRKNQFEFLVPGLLLEKITGLIKSLPKPMRRHFVPAPDFAKACYEAIEILKGDLFGQLEQILLRITGICIERGHWDEARLAEHLRFKFALVDQKNQVITRSHSLEDLQRFKISEATLRAQTISINDRPDKLTEWDFDELETEVYAETSAGKIKRFNALVDRLDYVEKCTVDTFEKAEYLTRKGVRRLLLIQNRQHVKYLAKQFPELENLAFVFRKVGSSLDLIADITAAVIDRCIGTDPLPALTRTRFEQWHAQTRYSLVPETTKLTDQLGVLAELLTQIHDQLTGFKGGPLRQNIDDIESQLEGLFFPEFIAASGIERLMRYPHYLRALQQRLEKLKYQANKDLDLMEKIKPWLKRLQQFKQLWEARFGYDQPMPASWWYFRWLLEEYRLSLFAQTIKTSEPVSEKRLLKYWQEELEIFEQS